MDTQKDGVTDRWKVRKMERRKDGKSKRQKDEKTERWKDIIQLYRVVCHI